MMRGSKAMAVAVRHPQGHIIVHREPLSKFMYQGWISRTPILRGLTLLWDALGLGVRSLLFSSNVAIEAMEGSQSEPASGETVAADVGNVFDGPLGWGMLLVSFGAGMALFFLLPAFLANLIENWLGIVSPLLGNVIEGGIRLLLLIGYIWLVGYLPDIARVFSYHGAEHKTIMAFESGAELEPGIVSGYSMYHPRCGTGLLLTVVLISILLFSLLGRPPLVMRLLSRIVLIPILAGISYEYLRFIARHQQNVLVRIATLPNLWLQRLTTRTPEPEMIEVAITALRYVLEGEEGGPVQAETVALGV